ncbi:MAG TPA: hypothetical protein VKA38_04880, partial [Draconibacterium sp.]|nr:hypothetical protein [Draconibacterium sp.]
PLLFVNTIHFVLVVLNALILLLLGYVATKKTGSVWMALLLQVITFISANTLDHVWTKVSPEPVLFFITCTYVIFILLVYADNRFSLKYVFLFALITGAGLATKATFLPLMLFPTILFPGIKKKLIYIGSVVVSFVFFTIPAIPQYKQMYFWFRDLIDHTGKYGHGQKGFIDASTFFPNILKIIENNPIFGTVAILSFLVLIIYFFQTKRNAGENKLQMEARILLALTITNIFGILLVAKHYHANHYLIPVMLLTGISIFFILKILLKTDKIVLPVLVIALIVFLSFKISPKIKYADKGYQITNEELDSTRQLLDKNYADYTKIYYYPYSLNKFSALNFGDVNTKHKLLPYLKEIYPNTLFYNFNHQIFQVWNGEISLDDIIKLYGNKLLLIGGPRDKKTANEMVEMGIPLKEIYRGRIQAIYELDTTLFRQIQKISAEQITSKIVCDAEQLTKDNQYYLGSNGENFGNAYNRTNETSRSGKFAIKMDSKTDYALYYELKNLQPGDNYEIEVWRKADNDSGRLVVAANDANVFYKAQNNSISSDISGWNLIRIKFTVTPELQNETLKIYLWNPKRQLVYFDDLTIKKVIYKKSESKN